MSTIISLTFDLLTFLFSNTVGAHLPFIGCWACRWMNHDWLWRMASATHKALCHKKMREHEEKQQTTQSSWLQLTWLIVIYTDEETTDYRSLCDNVTNLSSGDTELRSRDESRHLLIADSSLQRRLPKSKQQTSLYRMTPKLHLAYVSQPADVIVAHNLDDAETNTTFAAVGPSVSIYHCKNIRLRRSTLT